MARGREFSEKPLVALDPDKLFGIRQVTRRADGAKRDPGVEGGRVVGPRVQASRLLSKIGAEVPLAPWPR